jgi:ASC-1-like (ASCH) protein
MCASHPTFTILMENKSIGIEIPKLTHNLSIRPEFLNLIESGKKTLDVRVAYPHILRVSVGDIIRFNNSSQFDVNRIGDYENFDEMYENEDYKLIHPFSTQRQQIQVLRSMFPYEKEQLGIRVFDLGFI